MDGKSTILLFPSLPHPATSWAVHLFHSQEENSLFLLLTAPGHRLAPRRSVWGFREREKNVRQVPSPSCCLQISTRLLAFDLPMFPSFYLKKDVSWLRMGIEVKHSQTQIVCGCFLVFFLVSQVYSTLSLRCCYSASNCSPTVYSWLLCPVWI